MRGSRKAWFVLGFIMMASSSGFGQAEGRLRITLRVYTYAQVKEKVLARAEDDAAYILGREGIETVWWECPAGQASSADPDPAGTKGPDCGQDLGPVDFALRIVLRLETQAAKIDDDTLCLGFMASVSYAKAEELAATGQTDTNQILGCAIAHEIGHLLLGANAHSATGVMRARWGRADFERARKRDFRFTSRQGQQLRAAIQARIGNDPRQLSRVAP